MMTLERAQEIVTAINGRALVTMDLPGDLASLEGVSLAAMLQAKALVEAANAKAKADAQDHGGAYRIRVVPDDRLIAAVYTLDHYHHSGGAILAVPHGDSGNRLKVVAVQVVEVES